MLRNDKILSIAIFYFIGHYYCKIKLKSSITQIHYLILLLRICSNFYTFNLHYFKRNVLDAVFMYLWYGLTNFKTYECNKIF